MSNRETKTITTPLGKELVLNTYLTAREARKIRDVFLSRTKSTVDGTGSTKSEITDADLINQKENALLTAVVVSYDGSSENVIDRLLDLPSNEMQFVIDQATEVENPKTEK